MNRVFLAIVVTSAAAVFGYLSVDRSAEVAVAQFRSETIPYNGRFTFTRIRYGSPYSSRRGGFRGYGGSAWNHDYPMADLNIEAMLNEFTAVNANTEGSNVFERSEERRVGEE